MPRNMCLNDLKNPSLQCVKVINVEFDPPLVSCAFGSMKQFSIAMSPMHLVWRKAEKGHRKIE
jgi:hypothetical protein